VLLKNNKKVKKNLKMEEMDFENSNQIPERELEIRPYVEMVKWVGCLELVILAPC
jgi:hypothetical protein